MRAALVVSWMLVLAACSEPKLVSAPCASLVAGCAAMDGKVAVRTDMQPVPLQAFQVTVVAPQARAIAVSFSMQGMDMGPNRYRLVRQSDGSWQGRVTLPVCVSGRHDWQMIVDVDGQRVALPFQTH